MPGGDVSAGPDKKEFWVKMKWKLPGERSVFRLPLNFLYYRKWTAPGFEKGLSYINAHPELRNEEALLSRTGGKEVWKIPLPQEMGGMTAVYKICHGKKPWRYWFDLSLPAREFRNYQVLYQLDVPAAKVLAFGERRTLCHLHDSFFITEFLEGTRDGRSFMPGGPFREDRKRREEFWHINMPILAKLHKINFFSQGDPPPEHPLAAPPGWGDGGLLDRCRPLPDCVPVPDETRDRFRPLHHPGGHAASGGGGAADARLLP